MGEEDCEVQHNPAGRVRGTSVIIVHINSKDSAT